MPHPAVKRLLPMDNPPTPEQETAMSDLLTELVSTQDELDDAYDAYTWDMNVSNKRRVETAAQDRKRVLDELRTFDGGQSVVVAWRKRHGSQFNPQQLRDFQSGQQST